MQETLFLMSCGRKVKIEPFRPEFSKRTLCAQVTVEKLKMFPKSQTNAITADVRLTQSPEMTMIKTTITRE